RIVRGGPICMVYAMLLGLSYRHLDVERVGCWSWCPEPRTGWGCFVAADRFSLVTIRSGQSNLAYDC
ncbi:hypothetical protein AVEN_134560-2-1, partial [Araneus ventricosus]